MLKDRYSLILLILLIPILAYVGWQAYKTYIKPQDMDIEQLEETETEVNIPAEPVEQPQKPTEYTPPSSAEQPATPLAEPKPISEDSLERDPLKPSLPVKEKIEKLPEAEHIEEKEPIKETEPEKEIVIPTFTIIGIVWGHNPRVIIDGEVHKIGDTVKGAKIIDITKQGIRMTYEGKEFWASM